MWLFCDPLVSEPIFFQSSSINSEDIKKLTFQAGKMCMYMIRTSHIHIQLCDIFMIVMQVEGEIFLINEFLLNSSIIKVFLIILTALVQYMCKLSKRSRHQKSLKWKMFEIKINWSVVIYPEDTLLTLSWLSEGHCLKDVLHLGSCHLSPTGALFHFI